MKEENAYWGVKNTFKDVVLLFLPQAVVKDGFLKFTILKVFSSSSLMMEKVNQWAYSRAHCVRFIHRDAGQPIRVSPPLPLGSQTTGRVSAAWGPHHLGLVQHLSSSCPPFLVHLIVCSREKPTLKLEGTPQILQPERSGCPSWRKRDPDLIEALKLKHNSPEFKTIYFVCSEKDIIFRLFHETWFLETSSLLKECLRLLCISQKALLIKIS